MGDEEKPLTARRWNDVPGMFEWRLLQLENQRQDQEVRLRKMETDMSAFGQQLTDVKNSVENVEDDVKAIRTDQRNTNTAQNRNLIASIIAIVSVIATFILSHLPATGAPH